MSFHVKPRAQREREAAEEALWNEHGEWIGPRSFGLFLLEVLPVIAFNALICWWVLHHHLGDLRSVCLGLGLSLVQGYGVYRRWWIYGEGD